MNLEWWEFKDVMRIKCTDVDYGSKRVEGASDLGLDVEGCESLEASLEKVRARNRATTSIMNILN